MNMRNIVLASSVATGVAFALAPWASADDALTSVVASEISSMNFLFGTDAFLAGDSADVVTHTGSFDTVSPADAPQVTGDVTAPNTFDYLLYGLNPEQAGITSDPGAYSIFNGAMVQFDDGINSLLFAAMNNGDPLGWSSGDLFGGNSAMEIASATSGWDEAGAYFQASLGDLLGYLGIFS